jgi:predicted CXXCH cytochrome family protein
MNHTTTRRSDRRIPRRLVAVAGTGLSLAAMALVWLALAVTPVFADGGPHVLTVNDGSAGITADSCAACHRMHTSTSPTGYLLNDPAPTITAYCRSCHGATGTGATTDVDTGIQYALAGDGTRLTSNTLGALRGGGFLQARIASDSAYRTRTSANATLDFRTKVPVSAATPVTSAHLALSGSGLTAQGIAWGYGPIALSNPGTAFGGGLQCTSCHNPHGNGNYRILNPIPTDSGGTIDPPTSAPVYDAPLPGGGDTRNYSVIQIKGTMGTDSTFLLKASQILADQGLYPPTSGDYWRRYVPWNDVAGGQDAPNGRPVNGFLGTTFVPAFSTQMTDWCTQCHTRYRNVDGPSTPTGDGIFAYQHVTTTGQRTACTVCHVAHGTNAVMNTDSSAGTTFSANEPFPGQTTLPAAQVGNSRLLKMDNRGTCLGCHDPTNTIGVGQSQGTVPVPITP